ncbi:hypothetical protein EV145_102165 [Flavobacterium sp. 245]|nr:hypothetical protein EV145_102165 [Flavobacterium sp. 245]
MGYIKNILVEISVLINKDASIFKIEEGIVIVELQN